MMKLLSIKMFFALLMLLVVQKVHAQVKTEKNLSENFEQASKKGRYPEGEVTTSNGIWIFKDALVWDKEPNDYRPMSPRLLAAFSIDDEPGSITTSFELKGLKSIKVGFIGHKPDPGYFQVEAFVSRNKGESWESVGTSRGRYDKGKETFGVFKVNTKKDEVLKVKVVNASAPKLNRFNRINITLIEMECHN